MAGGKNSIPWGRTDGKPLNSEPRKEKPGKKEYRDCRVCGLPFLVKKVRTAEVCRDCRGLAPEEKNV